MKKRKRLNKKKFIRFLTILFLIVLGVFGVVKFGIENAFSGNESEPNDNNNEDRIILDVPDLDKRLSVLLIGADQRPEEQTFNTDTIIVASIDPDSKRISLLSIPRDTLVSLPGSPYLKINSIVRLAGFDALKEKITELTGIPLAGYVQTNFDGFKEIIDILGGIHIDVEFDMYKETGDKTDGVINLKKGPQTLDGAKALQYARYRDDALADIARTNRQQKVLKAIANEMMQLSTIPKLPWLIPQVNKMVETDLSLTDMFRIAKAAVGFDSENVISTTLPGGFKDIDGISYWEVIPKNAKKAVENLLNGIAPTEIEEVIDHTPQPIITKPQTPETPETPLVPGGPGDPNGTASPGHDSESQNENEHQADPGGQPDPGTEQPDPGTGQPDPGTEQPDPGTGQPDPGTGQPDPGIAQPYPGIGQPDPEPPGTEPPVTDPTNSETDGTEQAHEDS